MALESPIAFLKLSQKHYAWLAVTAIMLPIIWPFISRDSLPVATDAELHIFRLAELERLIRGGELYPRLAPNFYFGYGYPIFNYYSPFVYYFGVFIAFLPRIGPVEATKAVFVLGLLFGGWGTFGFVRDRWGTAAGIAAAALFGSAPYIQFIDPHARGVLAESFSLGLLPICFFLLGRLISHQQRRYFVGAAFAIAAFVLSHNLMAMMGSGLLLAWLVWQWLFDEQIQASGRWSIHAITPFLSFGLGISLSMFFWLPVALERNLVNLNTLVGEDGSHFAWTSHFLSIGDFFAFSNRIDWGAAQSAFRFNLGPIQAILLIALLGMVGYTAVQKQDQDKERLFWLLAGLGLLFFTLPVSDFLWRTVPVLPFIQFPWRFLGPAAIALAIGGGSLLKDWRLAGGIALLSLFLALPLTQVAPWGDFGPTDLAAVAFQEQKGRWLGTTSTADFIPATVETEPKPIDTMLEALGRNQTPDRVNRPSLPRTADVTQEEVSPLHFRYDVSNPDEFALRLFLYDFPGWRVQVNGETAEHEIGLPEGFIVVPLPAGDHTVDVWFGLTPARTAGWALSAISLVAILGLAFVFVQNGRGGSGVERRAISPIPPKAFAALGLAVLLMMLIPGSWLRYESAAGVVEPAEFQLNVSLDRQIELLAYDIDKQQARPGDWVELTLYWQAEVEPSIDFQVFVHLIDANGQLVAQSDKLNPGDFPTRRWQTDKYVTDSHLIKLPDNLPAGTYSLSAGMWVMSEGWRLPVLAADGTVSGDVVLIDEINVVEN